MVTVFSLQYTYYRTWRVTRFDSSQGHRRDTVGKGWGIGRFSDV